MSEHFPTQHETLPPPESQLERLLPTAEQAEALRPGEADPLQKAQEARQTIEQAAGRQNPLEELQQAENAPDTAQPTHINRELKAITLRRELQTIRRQLSAPQRTLSRVIHQPVIRRVSETASSTISRPSGLLGGGLVAFLGTSSYLYLAQNSGFRYNYSVFLALFVGGFLLGLVLEYIVYLATARHRQHD